jgi:hypothetical protein
VVAAVRDLEATTYLRNLESQDPNLTNETFSHSVAAAPNPRFHKPSFSSEEEAKFDSMIANLAEKAARDRVFNVRLFASQYDKSHDVSDQSDGKHARAR